MRCARQYALWVALVVVHLTPAYGDTKPLLRVGSKTFTESYVLGEIIAQTIEAVGEAKVERHLGLGGTGIVYQALKADEIDLYPEYSGTISESILKRPELKELGQIQTALQQKGLMTSPPLGFNNTYAIALRRETAVRENLQTLSDLARAGHLRGGFSHEFLKRRDGFQALAQYYRLKLADFTGLEHALAYEALATGAIDLTDIYSTDAKIPKYDLVTLKDDRHFFPTYLAVVLARDTLPQRFPKTWRRLQALGGRFDQATIVGLNAQVEMDGESPAAVAATFLKGRPVTTPSTLWSNLMRRTREHLALVAISLLGAVLFGVGLGTIAAQWHLTRQIILVTTSLVQTIPALALLCFFVPLFGIGTLPALIALFCYSLLPIVRNTCVGLTTLDPLLNDTAKVLGLSRLQQLWRVRLPLASAQIVAGIKTSAVINVGTATLAALIGAGGYGVPILTGLSLNDYGVIMQGALPAAGLALAVHALFEWLDPHLVPAGLRPPRQP